METKMYMISSTDCSSTKKSKECIVRSLNQSTAIISLLRQAASKVNKPINIDLWAQGLAEDVQDAND